MGDFDARYRRQLEAALESGEELRGMCAANHRQSAFKGGEKLKLMMMHGDGAFGKLGGGESQREGIAALAEWFGRLDAR